MVRRDRAESKKTKKKKLTWREIKELKREKKNWESFAKLLENTMEELKRTTRFSEMCDTIEKFIRDTDDIFQGENEEINRVLEKFENYLDKIQAENKKDNKKSKKLIEEVVSLYNSEIGGDLVFDGDVEKWFKRVFPLVALYTKNNDEP